jgi:hypothetical protein
MTQTKRWPDWTHEEDAILREHYPKGGKRAVASLLVGRTLDAIGYRVKVLSVKAGNVKRRIKKWEGTEKECLKCHQVLPLDAFSPSKLGRGNRKTWCKPCHAKWFRDNVPAEVARHRVNESRRLKREALAVIGNK